MQLRPVFVLALLLAHCRNPSAAPSSAPAAPVEGNSNPDAPPAPGEEVLRLAPTSSIGFTGAKVTASHDGSFGSFSGTFRLFPNAVERSRLWVTVQLSSLRIEPERLSSHLQNQDFFNVPQYPTASFVTTSVRAGGEGGATHTVTGNLTIRGQTRAVTFPARVTVTPQQVQADATFSINRREWGINYPGMPDNLIRDDVRLTLHLLAPRTATN